MKDYGTYDLECPYCNKIHKQVHMETEFPPWWGICSCGGMLTPKHITNERKLKYLLKHWRI